MITALYSLGQVHGAELWSTSGFFVQSPTCRRRLPLYRAYHDRSLPYDKAEIDHVFS